MPTPPPSPHPPMSSSGKSTSFLTSVYRIFSCSMLQVTPRACIFNFMLIILCHHMPMWIRWSKFDDADPESLCYHDYRTWTNQTFAIHIAIPALCVLSILITLLSPVFRSKVAPWTLHETPLIVSIFILYVFLAAWDIVGFRKTLVDQCLHDVRHSGMVVFDLVACCVILCIWLVTSCTWKQRTPDDVRSTCQSRMRCLTMALACKRYSDDTYADLYTFFSEAITQFYYVRSGSFENMLPTADALFGLHLLAKRQIHERETLAPPTDFVTDVSLLADAQRYGNIAGAMYGWRLALYFNPCAWTTIFASCQKRELRHHMNTTMHGKIHWFRPGPRDDISFVRYTGLDYTQVQSVTTHNGLCEVPFAVVRDEDRKEIVVAVRGSFSWYDALTDLLANSLAIDADEAAPPPHGETMYTHEGSLHAARYLVRELKSDRLKDVFWDFAEANCRHDDPTASWRIVVTGHSLGAGIATVATVMLRKYFHTVGHVYAPMPCLDEKSAEWSMSFMTTFIFGDDMVPRLSAPNIIRLRNEIMQEYQRTSNVRLLDVWLAHFDPTRIEPNVHPEWADLELLQNTLVTLAIPGVIYHITPTNKARTCTCEWLLGKQPLQCARRPRAFFDRLWVDYRSPADHIPHHYDDCIQQLIDDLMERDPEDAV
ncbi:Aste57867_22330 [Aphanomyces stellatus]|uniref:sn-1-specific diacylglycerol lipase n=1 Tax=Aphanomyces stellatus TaxID=120398 RepID=A0A485LKN3_9STRA|nr:hypothetical protein As57867_022260 [Aphanomyces stellatus]VFT98993.1 Aste57867_22330 [Aphanomyces stellatus]